MRRICLGIAALGCLTGCLTGCVAADYDPYVAAVENQLETRSYQTRRFEGTAQDALISALIGTLQDYHFRIQRVDPDLGVITAYQVTRSEHPSRLGGRTELTILIQDRGERRYQVRINMTIGPKVQDQGALYQKFFTAVSKRLHYETGV
jgi:hypothetical protein